MDWDKYKTLSHSPPYFTRWALAKTTSLLDEATATSLQRGVREPPLPKPGDHKGGSETDILYVDLTADTVATLVTQLCRVKSGEESDIPYLNALIKSWEELLDWLRLPDELRNVDKT